MGYTTNFYGKFEINQPLDDDTFEYLQKFSSTRRMKRDTAKLKALYGDEFGIEGEFFTGGGGDFGQDRDETIIDYNQPPATQPGLWCQWVPSKDRKSILWDGSEKFYNADDWIVYIIDKILAPKGYVLNGLVAAKGEDSSDFWSLRVENNEVEIETGWNHVLIKNGAQTEEKYCLKIGNYYLVKINDFSFSGPGAEESWSDLENPEDYYKIMTFDSKQEAEEHFKKIRIDTVFLKGGDVEIKKISDDFVLLNEHVMAVDKEEHDEQVPYGILTDSVYDFERYSVQRLFPI